MELPANEPELLERARALAGCTLAELSSTLGAKLPRDLSGHKGWVGHLVERALGATAGSRDVPDFEALGIELKTLPVDAEGRSLESTFVCTVPLHQVASVEWERSRVRCKLQRVLWIPVEGERHLPLGTRRIGAPWLWSPNPEQERILRFDWDTLAGLVGRGDIEAITGHLGVALQVRPKAKNRDARRMGFDEDGARVEQMPRGFYLRARFTAELVRAHFAIGGV